MESDKTRGSGWQHIKTSDEETYAMIFDVYILYEESAGKTGSGKDAGNGSSQTRTKTSDNVVSVSTKTNTRSS